MRIENLLEKLKTDQLQPLEVLQAYQAKALSVNKVVTKQKSIPCEKSDDDGGYTVDEDGLPSKITFCKQDRPRHYQARALSSVYV